MPMRRRTCIDLLRRLRRKLRMLRIRRAVDRVRGVHDVRVRLIYSPGRRRSVHSGCRMGIIIILCFSDWRLCDIYVCFSLTLGGWRRIFRQFCFFFLLPSLGLGLLLLRIGSLPLPRFLGGKRRGLGRQGRLVRQRLRGIVRRAFAGRSSHLPPGVLRHYKTFSSECWLAADLSLRSPFRTRKPA